MICHITGDFLLIAPNFNCGIYRNVLVSQFRLSPINELNLFIKFIHRQIFQLFSITVLQNVIKVFGIKMGKYLVITGQTDPTAANITVLAESLELLVPQNGLFSQSKMNGDDYFASFYCHVLAKLPPVLQESVGAIKENYIVVIK